jgi:hypothetical protein
LRVAGNGNSQLQSMWGLGLRVAAAAFDPVGG